MLAAERVNTMGSRQCCVPTCPKIYRVLHKFPKPDQKRPWKLIVFRIWLYRACNRIVEDETSIDEIVRNFRICDVHFSTFCKLPPYNKLRRGSLPTLHLPTFLEEPNEINSQFALLQYCSGSKEMEMFGGGYQPPPKWIKEEVNAALSDHIQKVKSKSEPPIVYTIPEISQKEVELNLQNVEPKQKTIPQAESKTPEVEKPYFKSVKIYLTNDKCLSEVCRICFCAIQDQNMIKLYESNEENDSQKFRDMLKQVLPGLDLDIYQNSVVCTKCKDLLVSSFELKTTWLATEEKLKKIIENETNNPNKTNASLVLVAGTAKAKKKSNSTINLNDRGEVDHDYARKTVVSANDQVQERDFEELIQSSVEIVKKQKPAEKIQFLCERCGKILGEKASLKKHQFRHCKRLKEEQQMQSMCESCGMMFNTLRELKKHLSRKHPKLAKKPVQYQCEICDKILLNKHSLQQHIRHLHLKIYNYAQCHLCGKKLSTRCALRSHLMIHNAEKRYSCEICSKKFYWLPALKKHLRKHVNVERKLACEFCGKLVKYESTLKQHIKIFHMKQGNTNCEFCGKPYWKKFDLIKHKIRIHGWAPEPQQSGI